MAGIDVCSGLVSSRVLGRMVPLVEVEADETVYLSVGVIISLEVGVTEEVEKKGRCVASEI